MSVDLCKLAAMAAMGTIKGEIRDLMRAGHVGSYEAGRAAVSANRFERDLEVLFGAARAGQPERQPRPAVGDKRVTGATRPPRPGGTETMRLVGS